jgi:hypothetical protein
MMVPVCAPARELPKKPHRINVLCRIRISLSVAGGCAYPPGPALFRSCGACELRLNRNIEFSAE